MLRAIIYLFVIIAFEICAVALPSINDEFAILILITNFLLIAVMIVDAAHTDKCYQGSLVLALTLVPTVHIFSMVIPVIDIPQILWYPAICLPPTAAALVTARVLEYKPGDIGLTMRSWKIQMLLPLLGLILGYIEYTIISPTPLIEGITWSNAWIPVVLLFLFTGIATGLIFNGLIQKSAIDMFGTRGIVYTGLVFAAMHTGWVISAKTFQTAWLYPVLAFSIAFILGWAVKKTGSLLGAILCHGVISVMFFIVCPLLFTA